jgi:hypothetical protein
MIVSNPMDSSQANDGAVAQFDTELDRLEMNLSMLEETVVVVSNRYDSDQTLASPRPEPQTEPQTLLHGRVDRLSDLNARLSDITRQIKL